jgi:hypothetical protein
MLRALDFILFVHPTVSLREGCEKKAELIPKLVFKKI